MVEGICGAGLVRPERSPWPLDWGVAVPVALEEAGVAVRCVEEAVGAGVVVFGSLCAHAGCAGTLHQEPGCMPDMQDERFYLFQYSETWGL